MLSSSIFRPVLYFTLSSEFRSKQIYTHSLHSCQNYVQRAEWKFEFSRHTSPKWFITRFVLHSPFVLNTIFITIDGFLYRASILVLLDVPIFYTDVSSILFVVTISNTSAIACSVFTFNLLSRSYLRILRFIAGWNYLGILHARIVNKDGRGNPFVPTRSHAATDRHLIIVTSHSKFQFAYILSVIPGALRFGIKRATSPSLTPLYCLRTSTCYGAPFKRIYKRGLLYYTAALIARYERQQGSKISSRLAKFLIWNLTSSWHWCFEK